MKIAVVGLGLIGGSLCKTIKKRTSHVCLGYDIDCRVTAAAIDESAVDEIITPERFKEADITFLCLYPAALVAFAEEYAGFFRPGSLVMDACGVKADPVRALTPLFTEKGVVFLGAHPMAGREFSGFRYAVDNLFENASFILTPTEQTPPHAVKTAKALAAELGFAHTVVSDPAQHDRIIAFTSQLAHVVSNAYIKSPTALEQAGFSAGSFLDLTRVARLNEDMWTQLFLDNRDALLYEVDTILGHLREYRDALFDGDADYLRALLRDGREKKEASLQTLELKE